MVALPTATAVTNPDEFTVATPTSDDDQVTVLLVAFAGEIVAVICCVFPTPGIVAVSGVIEIEETGTVVLKKISSIFILALLTVFKN